jgi:NADH-quinone oxidoreductase subunit J
MNEAMNWIKQNAVLLFPLLVALISVWWMLPKFERRRPWTAGLIGLAAAAALGIGWLQPSGEWVHDLPFYLFSGAAVGAGVLMITDRDPVHSALWFAATTLSVCGLFLLRSAAFLAAATAIVYAGAIIVVFLFVIMLARQTGAARYDQQAAQPLASSVLVFGLLGAVLFSIDTWRMSGTMTTQDGTGPAPAFLSARPEHESHSLSKPQPSQTMPSNTTTRAEEEGDISSETAGETEFGTLRGLGRSLFGDYLFAVEVAGTLLVVAAVGAMAIAPRTRRGTL